MRLAVFHGAPMGLVALVLGLPYAALAQDEGAASADAGAETVAVVQRSTERSPDEVEAYKAAEKRFQARMGEFEQDMRDYVAVRRRIEEERLAAEERRIEEELGAAVRDQRSLAIERFEAFVARYGYSPEASHVRFRLADLTWEQIVEDAARDNRDYQEMIEDMDAEEVPPPPSMDLQPVADLYLEIVRQNESKPLPEQYTEMPAVYYSLGFLYMEERADQYDPELAKGYYQTVIDQFADSDLVDDAHVHLGKMYFDDGNFRAALAEYKAVYDQGPDSDQYQRALYMLAWAYYKLDIYDTPEAGSAADATAVAMFTKLLDYSEDMYNQTGKRSLYAPEAAEFLAASFADLAVRQNSFSPNAVKVADDYFAKIGDRPYRWDTYVALGEVLTDDGRMDEAINLYERMQTDSTWKFEPQNPEFQMRVVKLHVGLGSDEDLAASARARQVLVERYREPLPNDGPEVGQWWMANRMNPEALAKARRYIEESLRDVAVEYRKNAEMDGSPEAYSLAAKKLEEYIVKFPISDDFYTMQWLLADSLYRGQTFDCEAPAGGGTCFSALSEYTSLEKSRKHHEFDDGVIYQLLRTHQQLVEAKHGPYDKLPPTAQVERTVATPFGNEVKVYGLSDQHKAMVATTDLALSHPFEDPKDPNSANFKEIFESNEPAHMYYAGQVLFHHNRFDEARPRLFAIIDQFPRTDEAARAAALLINSYQAEGDLEQVAALADRFLSLDLGAPQYDAKGREVQADSQEVEDIKRHFEDIREQAAFERANKFADAGKPVEAAQAFLQFRKDYPESEHVKDALYNAGTYYHQANRLGDANGVYEQYVREYPDDERSAGLYLKIASNAVATFELQKAISNYETLLKKWPSHPNAPDALFTAAFLKSGLGDNAGAARGYEEYAKKYPERPDAEATYWRAGEEWKKVSTSQAVAFYEGYRQRYRLANVEHALAADYELAQLYLKQGNKRKHDQYLDQILVDFDAIEGAGRSGELRWQGRRYAADSAFRAIEAEFANLVDDQLGNKDVKKDADLLNAKKVEVENFRIRLAEAAGKYQDFELLAAAQYLGAKALVYNVELHYSLRCYPNMSELVCDAFTTKLQEQWPTWDGWQAKAEQELMALIDFAKQRKEHSKWVDAAYSELHRVNSLKYPDHKIELRGKPSVVSSPPISPVRTSDAKKGAQ